MLLEITKVFLLSYLLLLMSFTFTVSDMKASGSTEFLLP